MKTKKVAIIVLTGLSFDCYDRSAIVIDHFSVTGAGSLSGKSRPVSKSIGDVLRERRMAEGLSQSIVARKAGIHAAMLSRIERDERSDPHFTTVAKIARVLSMSLDDIAARLSGERVSKPKTNTRSALVAAHAEIRRIRQHMERLAKQAEGVEKRLDSAS